LYTHDHESWTIAKMPPKFNLNAKVIFFSHSIPLQLTELNRQ
jgi:hypothetical protein